MNEPFYKEEREQAAKQFDVATYLTSHEAATEYLAEALVSGSSVFVDYALWVVARIALTRNPA